MTPRSPRGVGGDVSLPPRVYWRAPAMAPLAYDKLANLVSSRLSFSRYVVAFLKTLFLRDCANF